MDVPRECKYCDQILYKRCWKHSTAKNCECQTFDNHDCYSREEGSHQFQCEICKLRHKSKESLYNHKCQFKCCICRNVLNTKEELDSGDHGLKKWRDSLNCNECFVFVDDERAHLIKTKKGSDGLWAELQQKREEEQKQGEEFDNCLKKQEERSGWKKRGISKKRKAKEHEEMSSAKMLRKWLIVK